MKTEKIKGEDHYQCREIKAERDKLRAELEECIRAWALTTAEIESANKIIRNKSWVVEQLEAENQQLAAQVERLREALETITSEAERCDSWEYFPSAPIELARLALDETPAQALAETEAAAIESLQFPVMLRKMWSGAEVQDWIKGEAERLRTNKSGANNEH